MAWNKAPSSLINLQNGIIRKEIDYLLVKTGTSGKGKYVF